MTQACAWLQHWSSLLVHHRRAPPLQSVSAGGGSKANWPMAVHTQQGSPPELTKPFQQGSAISPQTLSLTKTFWLESSSANAAHNNAL